jgi:protein O-GlcNAc transferase
MANFLLIDGKALNADQSLSHASRLYRSGNLQQAKEIYQQIVRFDACNHEALNALGRIMLETGDHVAALQLVNQAVTCNPGFAEAHFTLGNVLRVHKRFEAAIAGYLRAIEIDPAHAEAYNYLGNSYFALGEVDKAFDSYQRALELRPDYAEAHNNMGNVLNLKCDIDAALMSYHKALSLRPELSKVHSNILFSMNYLPRFSAKDIYEESRRWDEQHGSNPSGLCTRTVTDVRIDRRLRVGYLSPDFYTHPVSFFCEPLFAAHDRDLVEVYCYSDVAVADLVTRRLKSLADSWCNTSAMPDEILIEQIRNDQIDLLVDLCGHTSMNRLALFARKPAPIQITWLGYPATTGLQSMDYRLTDAVADPEGEADICHSEKLFRLPDGFLCYAPLRSAPKVSSLPFSDNGFITFGSFNNLPKLTSEVLQLWAELLRRIPQAKLLLKNKYCANVSIRRRLIETFCQLGIAESRIIVVPAEPSIQAHLALYGRVDISLDPFPYNGTTTTFESLWMGVPTVTLSGERHSGRVGASILTRLGLDGLIASNPQEYLDIAQELSRDTGRLATLRASLRARLAGSSLCDAQLFTGNVETAYREMWLRFCRG